MVVLQVRYPKPWAYRNPYARKAVRRVRAVRLCPDCSAVISRGSQRCHRCAGLQLARENPTAIKVRELAAAEPIPTMRAIADEMGVTFQRVQQIIRQQNIPWPERKVLLEWGCPGCGKWISVARSYFERERGWNHMPAHCRVCSHEDRAKFCIRGHLRAENLSADGRACRACERERARCVIEVRTCELCHQPLNISRGALNQEKVGHAVGKYHRECWIRTLGGSNKRTHCRRGHEFTEENTYHWKDKRQCRTCVKRRLRERRGSGSKEESDDASNRRLTQGHVPDSARPGAAWQGQSGAGPRLAQTACSL